MWEVAVFSPHLGEVARASLARVTELCGAAFWRQNLFYYMWEVARGLCVPVLSLDRHAVAGGAALWSSRPCLQSTPRGSKGLWLARRRG